MQRQTIDAAPARARGAVAGSDGDPQRAQLVRGLTLADTTALVVGTVIGTGVFIKSAIMAQDAGSPMLVLAAWVAGGLLSLAGALTYANYTFLGRTMEWRPGLTQVVAIAAIARRQLFAVVVGGRVQTALTILKISGIAIVVSGITFLSTDANWAHLLCASVG